MDKIIDLTQELDLVDCFDNRYISQIPPEKLTEFFKILYKTSSPNSLEIKIPDRYQEVVIDDKYLGKDTNFFYYDEIDYNNKWQLPNIDFYNFNSKPYRNENKQTCVMPFCEERNGSYVIFSDYQLRLPCFLGLTAWETNPLWLQFMYTSFGEQYRQDLLNVRSFYRQYYTAKEQAKINYGISKMEEYYFPNGYTIKKTGKTFIENAPAELATQFHWYHSDNKPNVIKVTNFQTLKNEDIPEENKDYRGATILTREKNEHTGEHIVSKKEYQARQPRVFYENGEHIVKYPKKNGPIEEHKFEFNDFSYNVTKNNQYETTMDDPTTENVAMWRGVMYSAFGEPYKQAILDMEQQKIEEYLKAFDNETLEIEQIFQSFGQDNNLLPNNLQTQEQ